MRLLPNESQRLTLAQQAYLVSLGWEPLVVSLNGEDLDLSEYSGWVEPETEIVRSPRQALEITGWIEVLDAEEPGGPDQGSLFE